MRYLGVLASCALLVAADPASAQNRGKPLPPEPSYKVVALVLPQPVSDASFDAMRQALGDAAQKKDRAALTALIATRGFFWRRGGRNVANKHKSGFDNLSAILGLSDKGAAGWDILTGYAEDPTASPSSFRPGTLCAPAEPAYDGAAFDALTKTTNTAATEWGYPVSDGIEMHATPQANAPVIEKLGLYFVRIIADRASDPPSYMRIATPDGKAGFVSIDSIAPIGNDRICYVKDGDAWKIGGYIGTGEPL